jgi:predicted Zn finger-like uncharacterized protein
MDSRVDIANRRGSRGKGQMLISCPSCRADYEIADEALPASGRRARCSACGAVWLALPGGTGEAEALRPAFVDEAVKPDDPLHVDPLYGVTPAVVAAAPDQPAPEAIAPPPPAPPPPDMAETAPQGTATRNQRKGRTRKPAAPRSKKPWLIAASVIAACGLLLLVAQQRQSVVRLMPQTAALFRTIGLPVNLRGIEIVNVTSRFTEEGGGLLVVEGELVNIARGAVDVPRLRFAVRGEKGAELFVWATPADRQKLEPEERLPFRRRLAAPPQGGQDVAVRFVNRNDIIAGLK